MKLWTEQDFARSHLEDALRERIGRIMYEESYPIPTQRPTLLNPIDYYVYHAAMERAENSWKSMRQRCSDTGLANYKDYGGRGILVCKRWQGRKCYDDGLYAFLADMGPRPAGTTLDRIDVSGNYEPSNCRWATHKVQANNKRPRKARKASSGQR